LLASLWGRESCGTAPSGAADSGGVGVAAGVLAGGIIGDDLADFW
jgi:hypothetical protein